MLSIEDIYCEIGKNIFIYPLDIENFRDNSIDLTASEFAWTNDGTEIYDATKKMITIPPNSTACILTKEAIYVTSKIGGTYHSRVSLVQKGLGHISTMLDPEYYGQSLITFHNTTNTPVVIREGERIVSLVFYYLKTPIGKRTLATPPSHSNKIAVLDKEDKYTRWANNNQWANNQTKLIRQFKLESLETFKKARKDYSQKKNILARIWSSRVGRNLIKYCSILAIIALTLLLIDTKFNKIADWPTVIITGVVCLIAIIANDMSNGAGD